MLLFTEGLYPAQAHRDYSHARTFTSGLIHKVNMLGNHLYHNRSNEKMGPFITESENPQATEAL